MIRFIELFAGIGGFRYGLENVAVAEGEQSGIFQENKTLSGDQYIKMGTQQFTCVYANEWDKYAAQIYRRHYGEIDTRDIRDVSEFPEHDLLTAGFPCQDFSIAGKGAGMDGTRGTLFYEIARVLKHKRPRHLLLENVKGLISEKHIKDFHTILGVLSDLGYRFESMVLNSKHFGVPQNRERVFIIGHLRGKCTGEVFPVRRCGGLGIQSGEIVGENIQSGCLNPKTYSPQYRTDNSTVMIQVGSVGKTDHNSIQDRVYSTEGIAKTLAGEAGGKGAKTGLYIQDKRIRRLTPVECERLQGFPDGWTEGISDTQRYKCLGNAVTTNIITAIGEGLLQHIEDQGGI